MAPPNRPSQFGKRSEPVQVVIAKGAQVHSFSIKPWYATALTLFVAVFTLSYLAATSYLVFRDDLITFVDSRSDRMRHDYEDRIAYLRSQIDKMTSRSLVDQETLETKLEIMLRQQEELVTRHEAIGAVLDLARDTGIAVPLTTRAPMEKPDTLSLRIDASDLRGETWQPDARHRKPVGDDGQPQASLVWPDVDFQTTSDTVDRMTWETSIALDAVREVAEKRSRIISGALESVGLRVANPDSVGLGGPFIPAGEAETDSFMQRAHHAKQALQHYRNLVVAVTRYPLGTPIVGAAVSSNFGRRMDPFLKRPAMHSGIDYKAPIGEPVKATAAGRVSKVGRNGGYGKMVEIVHANGFTTRFAHLSQILVEKGDEVLKGAVIGQVGSTGRSTGPHLHYEVRINKRAVNPMPFVRAGRKLTKIAAR